MAEALDLIKGRAGVLLEIKKFRKGKYDGIEEKVLKLIEEKGMHDDVIILQVVNAVADGIFTLPAALDVGQTQNPQAVNALWFCTVGLNTLFCISHRNYLFGYALIAHTSFIHFIEHPKNFIGLVNQTTEQRGRVIGITKVHAECTFDCGKLPHFINVKQLFFPVFKN